MPWLKTVVKHEAFALRRQRERHSRSPTTAGSATPVAAAATHDAPALRAAAPGRRGAQPAEAPRRSGRCCSRRRAIVSRDLRDHRMVLHEGQPRSDRGAPRPGGPAGGDRGRRGMRPLRAAAVGVGRRGGERRRPGAAAAAHEDVPVVSRAPQGVPAAPARVAAIVPPAALVATTATAANGPRGMWEGMLGAVQQKAAALGSAATPRWSWPPVRRWRRWQRRRPRSRAAAPPSTTSPDTSPSRRAPEVQVVEADPVQQETPVAPATDPVADSRWRPRRPRPAPTPAPEPAPAPAPSHAAPRPGEGVHPGGPGRPGRGRPRAAARGHRELRSRRRRQPQRHRRWEQRVRPLSSERRLPTLSRVTETGSPCPPAASVLFARGLRKVHGEGRGARSFSMGSTSNCPRLPRPQAGARHARPEPAWHATFAFTCPGWKYPAHRRRAGDAGRGRRAQVAVAAADTYGMMIATTVLAAAAGARAGDPLGAVEVSPKSIRAASAACRPGATAVSSGFEAPDFNSEPIPP